MIRVKVVAPFQIPQANSRGEIDLPERITVWRLTRLLHSPLYAYALPVFVNGIQAGKRQVLQDGDLVVFMVPIAGG